MNRMEEDIAAYQPLRVQPTAYGGREVSVEHSFWNSFKKVATKQEIGAVSHISFCNQRPHHVAITSSTRVIIYDARTAKVRRTFARFKDKAYCGNFRQDGKVLLAGGEDGVLQAILQVFASDGRTLLRQLKGHKQAVHVALFSLDKLHVLSGGDDATVRYWDLSSGEQLCRLDGHTDYVRAASPNPASNSIWATGGYDHKCKLWNVESGEEIITLDHGSPVEALNFVPSGASLISGGGTEVRIWDTLNGRLMTKLEDFVKTVTSLYVFQPRNMGPSEGLNSMTTHVLTGSLDGNLRIYNLDTYKMDFIAKYPSPILSAAASSRGGHLIVGLADGSWSIRSRKAQVQAKDAEDASAPTLSKKERAKLYMTRHQFVNRGASQKPGEQDFIVPSAAAKALKPYDKKLRQFQFQDALDMAIGTQDSRIVAMLLEELACRNVLQAALGGRPPESVIALLDFFGRQIARSRSSSTVFIGVSNRLLRMYITEMGRIPEVVKSMKALQIRVEKQISQLEGLQALQGLMKPLQAASITAQLELPDSEAAL